jgi:hypothetical protein
MVFDVANQGGGLRRGRRREEAQRGEWPTRAVVWQWWFEERAAAGGSTEGAKREEGRVE